MKRKTTSLGYIGTCPSFAVMYDGQKYTIERLYGGSIRKKINGNCYRSDEEARAVLSDGRVANAECAGPFYPQRSK
jgi:hypothetical protein